MARHYTSLQIKKRYVKAMGPELGTVFHGLFNECAWVHAKWHEYVVLFGTDQGCVELLNRAAPGFVVFMQDALWEDVLMHISRLTDNERVAGKDTLTVKRLPGIVDAPVRSKVERRLRSVVAKTEFARDWRNRHLAHRDLRLALRRRAPRLKKASRRKVVDALDAIAALLNVVEMHYCDDAPVGYDFASSGGADSRLHFLRIGLEAQAFGLD